MNFKPFIGKQGTQLRRILGQYKLILLVIAVGALLLSLPTKRVEKMSPSAEKNTLETFSLAESETRFAHALSAIEGAGEVTVILTVKTGTRQVLAENSEFSQKDGAIEKESEAVVLSKGSGMQEAVMLQEIYPQFQGALIICNGGDDPSVRLKLVQAMSALTGLGADKISICKGK